MTRSAHRGPGRPAFPVAPAGIRATLPAVSAPVNPPCPFLPVPNRALSAANLSALGRARTPEFYRLALEYAQTQWQAGLPARALLMCNRALSCPFRGDEPVLREWPMPYAAVAWILRESPPGQFLGNPRRHFQHLATRMVEPHRTLRVWRAWACWWLACRILDPVLHPADEKQLREEGVVEPQVADIFQGLEEAGMSGEPGTWASVWRVDAGLPVASGRVPFP